MIKYILEALNEIVLGVIQMCAPLKIKMADLSFFLSLLEADSVIRSVASKK